uniref:Uncharacterized protein n=1 Tax=Cacopsylla melanoneura TaxID=428564 RepID=A0A8D9AFS5_9HEMI
MFSKKKKKKRQSVLNGTTQSKSPRKKSELLRTYLLLGCDSHLSSIVPHSIDRTAKRTTKSNFKVRKKSACSLQTILEPPDQEKKIRAYSITRDGIKTIVDDMTNEMMLNQMLGDQVKVARISKSGDKTKENVDNNQSQKNQSMKTEDITSKKCNILRLRTPKTEKSQTCEKSENIVADNLNLGEVTNNAEAETQPESDKHNAYRNEKLKDLNKNIRYFFLTTPSQMAQGTHSQRPHSSYGGANNSHENKEQSSNCHSSEYKNSHENKEHSSNCHNSYKNAEKSHKNKEQSSNCHSSYKIAKNSHENKEQSSNYLGFKRSPNNSQEQNKSSSNYGTSQVQQKKKKMKNVLSVNNLIALDEPIFHVNDYTEIPNKHLQELEDMAHKLKTKWRFIPYVHEPEDIAHVSESNDHLRNTTDHVRDKDVFSQRNSNEAVVKMKKYADKFRDPTAKILNDLKVLQDDFQSVSRALSEANADCDTGEPESSASRIQPQPASYIPVYDSNNNYVILQQAPAPSEPFVPYYPDKSHGIKQPPYYKEKSHDTKQPLYYKYKSDSKQAPYYKDKSHDSKQASYYKDKSHDIKRPISLSFGGPKSHKNQQQRAKKIQQKTKEHKVSHRLETDSSKKRSRNPEELSNNVATTQTTESLQTTAWHPQTPNLYSDRGNVSNRPKRTVPIGTPGVGPVHVIPLVQPKHIVPNQQNTPGTTLPTGCYYLSSQGYLYPTYNPYTPPNVMPQPQYVVSPEFYPNPVCGPQPHHSEASVNDNSPPGYVFPKPPQMVRRCPFQVKPQKTFFVLPNSDTKQSISDTKLDLHSKELEDMDQSISDESADGDSEEMKSKSVQIEYFLENVKQIGEFIRNEGKVCPD